MSPAATPPPGGKPGGRPGSQQGIAAARAARIAAAKAERERKAKAAKVRNLAIAIGAALVVAIVAVIVIPRLGGGSSKPAATPAGLTTYQGVTGSADGKASAPVTMVLFEDFQCPVCLTLEKTNGAEIDSLVASGQIRVIYSMISFLDSDSNGNKYSSRAANAYYCTPQAQRKALHDAFYENQPAEGTNGKTDAQILSVAKGAGVDTGALATCMKANPYGSFATGKQTTELNTVSGTVGTPTMLLNGQLVPSPQALSPSALDQYVAAAAAKASPSASN